MDLADGPMDGNRVPGTGNSFETNGNQSESRLRFGSRLDERLDRRTVATHFPRHGSRLAMGGGGTGHSVAAGVGDSSSPQGGAYAGEGQDGHQEQGEEEGGPNPCTKTRCSSGADHVNQYTGAGA